MQLGEGLFEKNNNSNDIYKSKNIPFIFGNHNKDLNLIKNNNSKISI